MCFHCGEVSNDHHSSLYMKKFTSNVSSAHLTKEIDELSENVAYADKGDLVTESLARKLQLSRESEKEIKLVTFGSDEPKAIKQWSISRYKCQYCRNDQWVCLAEAI